MRFNLFLHLLTTCTRPEEVMSLMRMKGGNWVFIVIIVAPSIVTTSASSVRRCWWWWWVFCWTIIIVIIIIIQIANWGRGWILLMMWGWGGASSTQEIEPVVVTHGWNMMMNIPHSDQQVSRWGGMWYARNEGGGVSMKLLVLERMRRCCCKELWWIVVTCWGGTGLVQLTAASTTASATHILGRMMMMG